MTTNEIISRRILTLVAGGMELPAAYDAVLGDGSYDKLVSELHDQLTK